MKRLNKIWMMIFGVLILLAGCDQPNNIESEQNKRADLQNEARALMERAGDPISGQYIVVFKKPETKQPVQAARQMIKTVTAEYNIEKQAIKNRYSYSVNGFAAQLDKNQLAKLKKDPRVKYVEQDRIVMLSPPRASGPWWCWFFPSHPLCQDDDGGGGQVTPYGVTRVGGPVNGTGLTAWIIDTGIDLNHEDLNVNVSLSAEFVNGENSPNDGNGHGTHVAGTIAAIDNNIDVAGVAAGATVVAVRVLNDRGSGSYSGVIAGVDYVAAHASPGDVANLSLGGPPSQALDDAIRNAADQGIYFALAAGNAGEHAGNSSPARLDYNNVWTISAIDENDDFAYFSNFGNPPVDYAAPGVNVESLWLNNGTNTISGTSMASPHAAAVLLLTGGNPNSNGTANGDPDGNPDPIIHN